MSFIPRRPRNKGVRQSRVDLKVHVDTVDGNACLQRLGRLCVVTHLGLEDRQLSIQQREGQFPLLRSTLAWSRCIWAVRLNRTVYCQNGNGEKAGKETLFDRNAL